MSRPLLLAALFCAAAAAAAVALESDELLPPPAPPARATPSASAELESRCPPGTLPDNEVCIPVPRAAQAEISERTQRPPEVLIPRRPDRPADYTVYDLPVDVAGVPRAVNRDTSTLVRAAVASYRHHAAGIAITAAQGNAVRLVSLEGQEGRARLIHVGPLIGPSVVTWHAIQKGGKSRRYVIVWANLAEHTDGEPGTELEPGTRIGSVGDAATPGAPALYLDVRLVRQSVDVDAVAVEELLDGAHSIPVDPRNVLPLKGAK